MALSAEQDWLLEARGGSVREFFADIGVQLPDRGGVEASVSCFANPQAHAHDDRNKSCSVNLITGLWHCKACAAQGNPYQAAQLAGRSDRDAALLARRHGLFLVLEEEQKAKLPTEPQLKKWRIALRENPKILDRLVELKGWTPYAIVTLGLGWDGERVTFPIRSAKQKIVGVVRYLPGGKPKTLAVPGSKRDLFPSPELIHRRHPLFLVEGEPDSVAVRSAGHRAVAVPGAGSWRSEWAHRLTGRRVVVLMDCDPQGRALAARVRSEIPGAHVVDLDPGRDDGFDVGDVVREAAAEGGLAQVTRLLGALAA